MSRRKPAHKAALTWIGIAVSYILLVFFVFTPISQPCGDLTTVWLRVALMVAMFALLVFVSLVGRRAAFWLAPQLIMLAFWLLSLPQELLPLNSAICQP